ncbi:MAG: DMT family transporter [Bryobacterales bacterium]|nr:DMT family transporter [Bryobacterales bacterium]
MRYSLLTTQSRKPLWIGPLFAVLAAVGFSAKAIFIKAAYATARIDSITLIALRMLFSLPFFLGMAWWGSRGQPPISLRDWALLSWFGFLGYYFSSLLDFLGLQYISASLERLILFTYPAVVLVLSAAMYGRSIHGREVLALVLSFAGIAVVFVQDLKITESPRNLWIGIGLIFGTSLMYALYLVGNTGLIRRLGSTRFTGMAASISSIFVLGHYLVAHSPADLRVPASLSMIVVGLSLVSTAIPIWMTSEALRLIGPNRVSIISSIGPILTIWMGALFLGETVNAVTYLGAILVLGGVALVTSASRHG